jgi:hypothetical protein
MNRKSAGVVVQFAAPEPEHITIKKTADLCWRLVNQTAQAWIEMGSRLNGLKIVLQSDEHKWLAAFGETTGRTKVADNAFPFGSDTADRLIKVYHRFSLHGTGENAFSPKELPPHWGTLYELSLLSNDELAAAKEKIHPLMTREQVKRLRVKKTPVKPVVSPKKAVIGAHAIYMRLKPSELLREVVALIIAKGLNFDDLRKAWEKGQKESSR